jgi:hypothetical protein
MSQPFSVPPNNIQAVIAILSQWSYSKEMMDSIGWQRELAEDELIFDMSLCVHLLGGSLPDKSCFNDLN